MSFDAREMRDALGRFATGVCVVTTTGKDGLPVGMTVNSFSSVSLDPPLILWSLQNNSDIFDTFANADRFAVNILALEQDGHSSLYAQKGDHRLAEDHHYMGKYDSPIIRDALVSFECGLYAAHEGGDHLIIVGRVLDLQSRADGDPLLFFSGGYRKLH